MKQNPSRMVLNSCLAAVIVLLATCAWSQTYKVLYNFTDYGDITSSGLTLDAKGNAYGTIDDDYSGGPSRVYELSPTSGYHLLYQFTKKGLDGAQPQGNLAIDSAGNLYGTTIYGGANSNLSLCNGHTGCGVVYKLSPPASGVGLWTQTILYNFCSQANCADGALPQAGVILDSAGNLYGTTEDGGTEHGVSCCGTVFELSPTQSGWAESVIHNFGGQPDGQSPASNLIFSAAGNLYGTTFIGGQYGAGAVFELSPASGGWTESVLYSFFGGSDSVDGCLPLGGVVFDSAGNLYGTTAFGGTYRPGCDTGYGTVFQLTPGNGAWSESVIHNFAAGIDGYQPLAGLAMDPSGTLYGTTEYGGNENCALGSSCGTVFRLTPGSDGQWTENLYRFPKDGQLGYWPTSSLILDKAGNVYGTTSEGGKSNDPAGVVFRITP